MVSIAEANSFGVELVVQSTEVHGSVDFQLVPVANVANAWHVLLRGISLAEGPGRAFVVLATATDEAGNVSNQCRVEVCQLASANAFLLSLLT